MRTAPRQLWTIVLLSAVFLLINIASYSRQPYVWIDEAYFADPAMNLVEGKGFTSSVWSNSPADQTFVSTAPLYSLTLSAWMRVFGVSMMAVRSFDYSLFAVALALIALAGLRLGLLTEVRQVLIHYLLVALGYGTSFAYRSARPEPLALLLSAIAFCSFSWKTKWGRGVVLFLLGLLVPALGPHLMVYFGLFFGVLALFIWRRVWLEGALFIAGMIMGFELLRIIYDNMGIWPAFVSVVESKGGMDIFSRVRERLLSNPLKNHSATIPKDFSLFVLLLLAPLMLWRAIRKTEPFHWKSLEIFNVIFVLTIFLGMFIFAKFSTYYSWMVYVPMSLTCCIVWHRLDSSGVLRWLRNSTVILACLVGLPMQLALAMPDWNERDPAAMGKWVGHLVNSDDVVFSDYPCFYPVKSRARNCYFVFHLPQMAPEKKAEVTLLILSPHQNGKSLSEIMDEWGEDWTVVDKFVPAHSGPLGHDWRFGYLSLPNYELTAYRKASTLSVH